METESGQFTEYRTRRSSFYVGACMTPLFLGMVIFILYGAIFNPDGSIPNPALFLLVTLPICTGFAAIGVYLILAYYRERLILTPISITQHTVFASKEIQFEGYFPTVVWPGYSSSLKIQAGDVRIKIHLDN